MPERSLRHQRVIASCALTAIMLILADAVGSVVLVHARSVRTIAVLDELCRSPRSDIAQIGVNP